MNNLTIKLKLIISFTIVCILIVTLGLYSIFGIDKAAKGFSSYREMAKDTVLASNVQSNMLMVRMNVKDYIHNMNKKDIEDFEAYYDKTKEHINKALKEIENTNRKPLVEKLSKNLEEYRKNFFMLTDYMEQRNKIVYGNLDVNGKEIENLLTKVMNSAQRDSDLIASLEAAKTVRTLLLARLYSAKFLISNKHVDNQRAHKEFNLLKKQIASVQNQVQNNNRLEQLKEATALIEIYKSGLNDVIEVIDKRNKVIERLDTIGPNIANIAQKLKTSIKKEQDTIGPDVAETNYNLELAIKIISLIVISIILILGVYIPRDINNQIIQFQEGLLNFFKYLNREIPNVEELKNTTKTEIGIMSKVVNENIKIAKKNIEEDRAIINETVEVLSEFEKGDLYQRITTNVNNPALNKLKDVLNNMGDTLEQNIDNILDVLEQFSNYNYLNKVDTTGIKEHLERLANGVNSLGISITSMLIENKSNGLTLNNSSKILLENVDTLNISSNEAAASLEQTAAALEEITSNISLTTQKITKMNDLTSNVTSSANKGEDLAIQTTTAMEDINTQVSSINEAITVIDQIAFQTNILSLNAAVEAATAGEAGKGFAVVAQEVRNLASRSAEAAKEIKDLVEKATLKANEGKNIAHNMQEGYVDLKSNINETIELISDVSNAANEQQTGIVQINDAINSLDEQTQKNAGIANQTQEIATTTSTIANTIVENANAKEFLGKDEVKEKKLSLKNIKHKEDTKIKKEEDSQEEIWENF
ncbi:HAMP domain-containing methyl-accepting chemotaxis protein [Arcobacter roscoffensis]|uniref:Methyl-accepting chemotaxis protein n=1 Tax=Arcobacter roscoffensis TaxID=2961520 RepID=A0ABY5E6B9_9BACT|nr:methyl-accepting chemotaxis protein [Arcobacter roscoffensis]UTJ07699.1 methyl-accepting chemotaxis protein [Arcobacter roscoffensis]